MPLRVLNPKVQLQEDSCIYTQNHLPEDIKYIKKLKYLFTKCAFLWFILCNYSTKHGKKKNIKL
jgi:hypothetical protein